MTPAPAPFNSALSAAPEGTRAFWIHATDGVRLRAAHFPAHGAQGTVLLFPGRTEYVEKYGHTASDLVAAGYHVLAIDWRGQGLADRLLDDPRTGHVDLFSDYQKDVAALVVLADDLDLPKTRHLIAHSMGGCIGLRAVMDGLDVASCAFSGPMWGIRITRPVRPAAWALSWSGKQMGFGHMFAPGTGSEPYVVVGPFEDNTLTRDPEMWDTMRHQVTQEPSLQLGGPSLTWLHEALGECRALARRPSPDLPCICYTGDNERIVDTSRIHDRMARWPGGRLDILPECEHEVMMEAPHTRKRVLDSMITLFDTAGGYCDHAGAKAFC